MAIKGLLNDIQDGIKFSFQPALADLVNWGGNEDIPVNRWFRYREAYSPNLITELNLGQNILDPFCGCGSIMVGAATSNRYSVGIDINPIAVFAARVKLTPLTKQQLKRAKSFLDSYQHLLSHRPCWPLPALSIADKVFEPEILETVGRLRSALEEYASDDERLRNFLLLAWLSILESVGSYFKEGNGIKYRNKKRLKSGYIRREDGEWQRKRFGEDQPAFVCDKFSNQLSLMLSDVACWGQGLWSGQQVHEGSALELSEIIQGQDFD